MLVSSMPGSCKLVSNLVTPSNYWYIHHPGAQDVGFSLRLGTMRCQVWHGEVWGFQVNTLWDHMAEIHPLALNGHS